MQLDPRLLEILACPDCHASLRRRRGRRRAGCCTRQLRAGLPGPRRHPGAAGRRGPQAGLSEPDVRSTTAAPRRPARAAPRADRLLRRLAEAGRAGRARRCDAARPSATAVAAPIAAAARGRWSPAGARTPGCCRAVLEPCCPVPFVAWPGPALPGWVGALDLVVVLAPARAATRSRVRRRRGGAPRLPLVVACPAAARWSPSTRPGARLHRCCRRVHRRPARDRPSSVLELLDRLDLGPASDAERGRRRARRGGGRRCSPYRDLAVNPAKTLALELADTAAARLGRHRCSRRARPRRGRRVRSGAPTRPRRARRPTSSTCCRSIEAGAGGATCFADPFADVDDGGDTRPSAGGPRRRLPSEPDESAEQRGRARVAAAERRGVRIGDGRRARPTRRRWPATPPCSPPAVTPASYLASAWHSAELGARPAGR